MNENWQLFCRCQNSKCSEETKFCHCACWLRNIHESIILNGFCLHFLTVCHLELVEVAQMEYHLCIFLILCVRTLEEGPPCWAPPRCVICRAAARASNEGYPKVHKDFTITEKAPTRAFSQLKAPTRSFKLKTLCLTGVDPTVSRHEIGTQMHLS